MVEAVGLRITTLRDVNGTVWYVRNGEILRVGNKSQGYAVAVVDLPLAHSADIAAATELLAGCAARAGGRDGHRRRRAGAAGGARRRAGRAGGRHAAGHREGQARASSSPCSGRLNAAIADAFDDAGVPRPSVFPSSAADARPSRP